MKKVHSQIDGIIKYIDNKYYLIPIAKKALNRYLIPKCDKKLENKLVKADIISNSRIAPKVKVISVISSPKLLSEIAIYNHEITKQFSNESIKELENISEKISIKNRKNLMTIPLVTVDDETAKDHDDAVYAEPDTSSKNKGGWKILVSIADVSNYIPLGSSIDKEAKERGNSIYFPDQVVPMLPEKLSNDLCSLRPNVKRYCLSTWITIDKNGTLLSSNFFRGVMKSHAKLTYTNLQKSFDTQNTRHIKNKISLNNINNLYNAYKVLLKNKKNRGTLDIDIPEQQILLDSGNQVKNIITRSRLDSHKLIEEFMILSNIAASKFINKYNVDYLSRVHDSPREEKLQELYTFLTLNNIAVPKNKNCSYKQYNAISELTKETVIENIVKLLILRTQSQAIYSPDNIGHYGLNLEYYAHFTSPIRRYADLTIHRSIINILNNSRAKDCIQELNDLGEFLSHQERIATKAERETNDRYSALYMKQQNTLSIKGHINGITEFALFITLNESMADAILPLKNITGDYFIFDTKELCIKGRKTKIKFSIGDQITVNIEHICEISGKITLNYQVATQSKSTKKNKYKRNKKTKKNNHKNN